MKRWHLILTLGIAALFLFGCSENKPTPFAQPAAAPTGAATLTIKWPARTRLIPAASNSIVVQAQKGATTLLTQTIDRPAAGGSSTVSFTPLPIGTVTLVAKAYPFAGGTGNVQAGGTTDLTITPGAPTAFAITMNTTVTQVVVTPAGPLAIHTGDAVQLRATPEDATGAEVLVADGDLTWKATNAAGTGATSAVASVDATGLVTSLVAGATEIVATEKDSARHSAPVAITVTDAPANSPKTIAIAPTIVTLAPGATQSFTAALTGTTNPSVTWSITNNAPAPSAGKIDEVGNLVAPLRPGVYTVRATSVVDIARTADATVIVTSPLSVTPTSVTLDGGAAQQFTVVTTGLPNGAVTWSIPDNAAAPNAGVIDSSGLLTAPTVAGVYHVQATSVVDGTIIAAAVVSVRPVTISLSPISLSLAAGATQQYIATVTGNVNATVTWSIPGNAAGANAGSITSTGLLTAPKLAGNYTVRATSVADASKTADAQLVVLPTLSLAPATITLPLKGTYTLTANLSPCTDNTVDWSVAEGNGGTVVNGVYTAPAVAGTYHVQAASHLYPGVTAQATITVQSGSATITLQ